MPTGRRNAVPAPQAQPPRYGLLVAAQVDTSLTPTWMDGVQWRPEQCASSGRYYPDCGADPATGWADLEAGRDVLGTDPFYVYGTDACSPTGLDPQEFIDRARRAVEATRSYQVADEFWSGGSQVLSPPVDSADYDAPSLVDTVTELVSSGDTLPAVLGLAQLEASYADAAQGRRGMVHVTTRLFTMLAAEGAIYREGAVWLTPLGNIVVADAGYSGDGPAEAAGDAGVSGMVEWAYATGMVLVRQGPLELFPSSAEAIGEAFTMGTNDVLVLAQQLHLVQWDPCGAAAVRVDLSLDLADWLAS